jgi:two-component system nitrogen regulation sensor histidine kinase NtrY
MLPLFRLQGSERRYVRIVFFVFGAILLVRGCEIGTLFLIDSYWDSFSQQRSAGYIQRSIDAFLDVQRATRRIATEIALHPVMQAALLDSSSANEQMFSLVTGFSREEGIGLEVYNRTGTLVAWDGPSGPPHTEGIRHVLDGRMVSYVDRTPIYSQLFVAIPVRTAEGIAGAVLVRRSIEVNFPFDNRFIGSEGLADRLTQSLGVSVEFDFSPDAVPTKDGRFLSASLYGIDSARVGTVSIHKPVRSAYLDGISTAFRRGESTGFAAFLLLVAFGLIRRIGAVSSILVRSLGATLIIWSVRYALLWSGFPSLLFSEGIFDPMFFASKFGGGMAKSIAEMTVTSLALGINTWLVARSVLEVSAVRSPWWNLRSGVARVALALAGVGLTFLLLRGFAAVVRSAVYDSTLEYMDPKLIVPSFELGLMVFNLFLISFCLIIVVLGITSFLLVSFSRGSTVQSRGRRAWLSTSLVFALGAVLFGLLHPSPLSSIWYRLLFAGSMIGFTFYLHAAIRRGHGIANLRNVLIALGLSAVFFYPLLAGDVDERDRDRVQVFASELLRPSDGWIKYLVEESLRGFLNIETEDILANGQREEIAQLAFAHWARSPLNREGYSCLFLVTDASGRTLSDFEIGGADLRQVADTSPSEPGVSGINVFEADNTVSAAKIYVGSVPIPEHSEHPIAYATVVVSAGKEELLRGQSPPFLRGSEAGRLQSFYRPTVVTEYRNGVLFATKNNPLPISYALSERISDDRLLEAGRFVWKAESIGGRGYETLFVRSGANPARVISITMQDMDLTMHLYNIIKMLVYYAIAVITILLILYGIRWMRGTPYAFTFRDKLLAAFVVTALIPMVIIAVYSRGYAEDRMLQGIADRLEQETATAGRKAMDRLLSPDTTGGPSIRPEPEGGSAEAAQPDYNLYVGTTLRETSRPELYESGILDTRLSGAAYLAVVVEQERFHLQTENIGRYQYAVGYRPLLDAGGKVLAVVSVPTLYRQDQLEAEIAQRDALLFGVFAFVSLAIGFIATAFANRLAGPIHRLTDATKRVSRGDLDVEVNVMDAEGEIGELIRSFGKMTHDLKVSREHLVRYEREMAWKEMAKQVAHEIKNPLTPMKLSLQHLKQLYSDNAANFGTALEEISRTIINQIDGLSRIASEFSHFGRMPRRNPEVCDVNGLLREAARLFDKNQAISFSFGLDARGPSVIADHEELRRAFINIIRNGIQAMSDGGEIFLGTGVEGGMVVITIRDQGGGIPEEIRPKLFEPNFSTKSDGMGLGLAIVRQTVNELGGTIGIESELGRGTTVTVHLPLSMREESPR